jgi:hypothetical protein
MFAANGIGILHDEKAQCDIAKELFTHLQRKLHQEVYLFRYLMYGPVWLIYILLKAFFNKQLRRTKIVRGSSSTTQMQLYSYTLP